MPGGTVEGEASAVGKTVEDSFSFSVYSGGAAIFFLIEEVTGFLTLHDIHFYFQSVFDDDDLGIIDSVKQAFGLPEPLFFPHCNVIAFKDGAGRKYFRKTAQMIFQDPQASLNGRMKIRDIIAEGIDIHKLAKSKEEREAKVKELINLVGLNEDHLSRYPHEFSGGQRQRIGIARALAVNPHFIVADEPISALDVSIQAQVVNLMQKLQHEQGLTYLFIAHDLSMVKYISDRIGVMHWGKLLEVGPADEIYHNPIHPYTKSLLSAIPEPDPERERKRQHLIYDSSIENDGEKRQMYEIRPGHFVYATEAEAKNYKEEA